MKNIYSQLVLTFILVIAASFLITLLMSDWVFQRQQVNFVEDRIMSDARSIAQIQAAIPDDMMQDYIDSQGGQTQIVVIGEDGKEYRSSSSGPGGPLGFSSPPRFQNATSAASSANSLPANSNAAPQSSLSSESLDSETTASTSQESSPVNRPNPDSQWVIPENIKQLVLNGGTYHPQVDTDDSTPGVPSFNFNFSSSTDEQKEQRYVGIPFERDGVHYALFVRPSPGHFVNQFNQWMILALSVMLVTGTLLFLFAARLIAKPITKLSEATRRVAKGDYNVHVDLKRRDEIGQLGNNFNQMITQLSKIEAMRQEFVSNVSHEIQTPLTSIRGFASALKDQASGEQLKHLQIIEKESERLSKLSSNLLKLASLDVVKLNKNNFQLDEQIRRAVVSCGPMWIDKDIELSADLDKIQFNGDEDLLTQVWINLLSNAIKFTPEHGNIYITLTQNEEWIIAAVKDTGCGISAEHQAQIFERFYKADTSRNTAVGGSGLGLSIVQKILLLHEGRIEVHSEVNQGTIMTVYLPRSILANADQ